jgi:hypothetical protein
MTISGHNEPAATTPGGPVYDRAQAHHASAVLAHLV